MVRLVFLLGWGLLADERRNQQDEAVQDLLHNDDISLRDWCSIDLWRLRRFGGDLFELNGAQGRTDFRQVFGRSKWLRESSHLGNPRLHVLKDHFARS